MNFIKDYPLKAATSIYQWLQGNHSETQNGLLGIAKFALTLVAACFAVWGIQKSLKGRVVAQPNARMRQPVLMQPQKPGKNDLNQVSHDLTGCTSEAPYRFMFGGKEYCAWKKNIEQHHEADITEISIQPASKWLDDPKDGLTQFSDEAGWNMCRENFDQGKKLLVSTLSDSLKQKGLGLDQLVKTLENFSPEAPFSFKSGKTWYSAWATFEKNSRSIILQTNDNWYKKRKGNGDFLKINGSLAAWEVVSGQSLSLINDLKKSKAVFEEKKEKKLEGKVSPNLATLIPEANELYNELNLAIGTLQALKLSEDGFTGLGSTAWILATIAALEEFIKNPNDLKTLKIDMESLSKKFPKVLFTNMPNSVELIFQDARMPGGHIQYYLNHVDAYSSLKTQSTLLCPRLRRVVAFAHKLS